MDIYNDPTATAQGEFADGDPLAVPAVPRTVLRDIWPNMIQRELINLVEGAGLTLDGNDFTQVLQAVQALSKIATPTSSVQAFATFVVPTGWLECDGQAVSRDTYADLFMVIGTLYGSGDGSTTFNVPDLRGEFIRGWDHGRGVDPDDPRSFGSSQSDAMQNVTGNILNLTSNRAGVTTSGAFSLTDQGSAPEEDVGGAMARKYDIEFDASEVSRTSSETRPRNIALMYCIKY